MDHVIEDLLVFVEGRVNVLTLQGPRFMCSYTIRSCTATYEGHPKNNESC